MEYNHIKTVDYSFEHGDESLPHLKDLATDIEDPEKSKILSYLRTGYAALCSPGIKYDEITPGKVIGHGDSFFDGTYVWNDVFINYVDRYNIPIPTEFREHILQNFDFRMKRYSLLWSVDSVEIQNEPSQEYHFNVRIYKNGIIKYWNNTDPNDKKRMFLYPERAYYIINPIMSDLFFYDRDNHGNPDIGGYHWKLIFYKNSEIIEEIEGWPDEDRWRYNEIRSDIEFAERYIPWDLGSKYMNFYENEQQD